MLLLYGFALYNACKSEIQGRLNHFVVVGFISAGLYRCLMFHVSDKMSRDTTT